MSYNKKTWKNGDVITAAELNRMEDGISDNKKTAETHATRHGKNGDDPITLEMIGAAPAGFGWGGILPRISAYPDNDGTLLDRLLDEELAKLEYREAIQISVQDHPYLAINGSDVSCILTKLDADNNFAVLRGATYGAGGTALLKVKDQGVWHPWEYINPPMQLGVEYRTTERYMGKPVYAKLFNFGMLPNTEIKNLKHDLGTDIRPVAFGGVCSNGNSLPYLIDGPSGYRIELDVDNTQFRICTYRDRSDLTATVWVKYIKTTD